MRRLLTTVAFSALILGFAAPGLMAADTTSTSQTTPSVQSGTTAQTNQATPSNQGAAQTPSQIQSQTKSQTMAGTSSATDQQATTKKTTKKKAQRTSSRDDRMANELNRQELARIQGSSTTSYGSTGAAAPSSTGTQR